MKHPLSDLFLYRTTLWTQLLAAGALSLSVGSITGCGEGNDPSNPGTIKPGTAQTTPPTGATRFVSADGRNGQASQENTDDASRAENNQAAPSNEFDGAAGDAADERTVEEGDIYRVAGDSKHIFNLNTYRGFQIIDVSDPTSPSILGKVRLGGTPVEMYQVGDRVFVLLNNWRSYWQSRHASPLPEAYQGGGVVVIDISDKTKPTIAARAQVPGWIRTSRMTRGNGKEALFVVASEYNGGGKTHVKSFSVDDQGKLQVATQLELGGTVQDIQGTPQHLIVARYDNANQGQRNWAQSLVSLIDISSPEGTMVEGPQVQVKGRVRNKFNMDIHNNVLRVVSGNSWGNTGNTNHVETFQISGTTLTPVDHKTFGDNEDLYATLFMQNKAFFVTYRRVDPFHAFEITDAGQITEKSEFIVSGWNDFFKPVNNRQRLIGIGKNDQNGSTMAVSLYNITDLTNPSPMIARAEVDLTHSWSEAQWDDRAFSVLEKATNVMAPDGVTPETGMVLLPFSGWDDQAQRYVSQVQIYTFSANTLTLRGTMDHGTRVRRSFQVDRSADLTGNLSEAELSLFTTTNADTPVEKGRVELAPNYAQFHIFGSHGLRHHDRGAYYSWWGGRATGQQTDSLQVVALTDATGAAVDVDEAPSLAEIQIPAHAQTYRVGDRLVALSADMNDNTKTDVQVWNLATPTTPSLASATTVNDLQIYGYYGGYYDCFDCRYGGYYGGSNGKVVGDAVVFPRTQSHRELLGKVRRRYIRPTRENYRWQRDCYSYDDNGNYQENACTYHEGSYNCSRLTRVDGTVEAETCTGQLFTCTQDSAGERSCTPVSPDAIPTRESEYTNDQYRYWSSYELDVLDLSDPANPVKRPTIKLPTNEEASGLLVKDTGVYLSYKKPIQVAGDSRPYVAYFYKKIDLTNPAAPQIGAPINIPGTLIAVTGDTILTRDFLWGQKIVETSVNRLKVQHGLAYLQGAHRFTDQQVGQVVLDGAGHALVSHQKAWYAQYEDQGYSGEYDYTNRLTILDVNSNTLAKQSTMEVDDWATLKDARPGRALYQVPGGLLVLNIADATKPKAQAYFPTLGWPRDLTVHNDDVFFSGGRYGLYRFDLNTNNLSVP